MVPYPDRQTAQKAAAQAYSLFEEFKAFAFKGNVIDLALGVIIGTAFAGIIQSLVKDVLMPLVSVVLPGQHGYEAWELVLRGKSVKVGLFLAQVVNFLIVALVLYVFIVKLLGWLVKVRPAEPKLTTEQALLTEIRDLLKARASGPES